MEGGGGVKTNDERLIFPDAQTPPRLRGDKEANYFLDLKPNTKTGRAAGARKKADYEARAQTKTRVVYYNPDDYKL